jgi:hypothetical protein
VKRVWRRVLGVSVLCAAVGREVSEDKAGVARARVLDSAELFATWERGWDAVQSPVWDKYLILL